jgi:hypothetical protein
VPQVNFTTRANLAAGLPENINDVGTALDQLRTGVNAIDDTNLVDGAVTTAKLAAGSVTTAKLDAGAVDTGKIADGNVTYAKLATDAKNAFLKLDVAGDKELRYGSHVMTYGFAGGNRTGYPIPHGLGRTPDFAFVWASYIGSGDTSTVQNEPVIASLSALDATNITCVLALANGATTSVGSTLHWAVIG